MSDSPNSWSRWAAPLVVLTAFLLGVVSGGALFRVFALHHGGPPHFRGTDGDDVLLEHLTIGLKLTPAQVEKLRPITLAARSSVRKALDDAHGAIREVLTEEQQKRFDRMLPPPLPPPRQ